MKESQNRVFLNPMHYNSDAEVRYTSHNGFSIRQGEKRSAWHGNLGDAIEDWNRQALRDLEQLPIRAGAQLLTIPHTRLVNFAECIEVWSKDQAAKAGEVAGERPEHPPGLLTVNIEGGPGTGKTNLAMILWRLANGELLWTEHYADARRLLAHCVIRENGREVYAQCPEPGDWNIDESEATVFGHEAKASPPLVLDGDVARDREFFRFLTGKELEPGDSIAMECESKQLLDEEAPPMPESLKEFLADRMKGKKPSTPFSILPLLMALAALDKR